MFQSFRLGRVMGIDLFIHPTFWLLPLFVVLGTGAGWDRTVLDLAVLCAAFGCIALHELGHALAARQYGIRTHDIVLYPLGGVARLENMPERPWPEIVVALAGPLVNVLIALGILGLMTVDGASIGRSLAAPPGVEAFWSRLLVINVWLVLFNLIPAFPMDGGRVLRAALCWFLNRVTATEVAAVVGAVFAGLLALYGLFGPDGTNLMLVLVAVADYLMGRGELAAVRAREAERRWYRESGEEIPIAYPVGSRRRFTGIPDDGWVWDPETRMWTLWRGGYAVRRVRGE
jgi:Zn-dependent protease